MPKSNSAGKMWSYKLVSQLHARAPLQRILDVGAGLGIYARFREPGQHWTAVEAWAPYVKSYALHTLYDHVIVADIRYLDWQRVAPLDLVICGDVLEHMSKEDALDVVHRALDHARVVLISLPVTYAAQGELLGNPFEVHVKPDWSHPECMESFPDICLAMQESYLGIYFLTRSSTDRRILEAAVMGVDLPVAS